jgi:aspartyl protease family protein
MLAWIGLVLVGLAGGAIAAFGVPHELLGLAEGGASDVIRIAALILSICMALLLSLKEHAGLAFRQASLWMAIVLVGASVYTYRADLMSLGSQVAGDYLPDLTFAQETQTSETRNNRRMVAIRAGTNGHFDVDTLINGTHVSMLADTGATFVTLAYDDARRIGIDVNGLNYDVPLRTANGVTYGAVIDIDEVDVGGILVRKVPAIVSQADVLAFSLLGMSYFREIGSFQLSGDQLILRE